MPDKEILKKVNWILDRKNLDAIIIKNSQTEDPNFFYLSGIGRGYFEGAYVVFTRQGPKVFASSLDLDIIRKHGVSFEALKKHQDKIKAERIGINHAEITMQGMAFLRNLSKAKFVDVPKELAEARAVKTKKEIQKMRTAGKISMKVIAEAVDFAKVGITENQLAAKMEHL